MSQCARCPTAPDRLDTFANPKNKGHIRTSPTAIYNLHPYPATPLHTSPQKRNSRNIPKEIKTFPEIRCPLPRVLSAFGRSASAVVCPDVRAELPEAKTKSTMSPGAVPFVQTVWPVVLSAVRIGGLSKVIVPGARSPSVWQTWFPYIRPRSLGSKISACNVH